MKKKIYTHKIRPDKDYDSIFARVGGFELTSLGIEKEITHRKQSIPELMKALREQAKKGHIVFENIDAIEKEAREVLESAGLPSEAKMYPWPDGQEGATCILGLVGKEPTPEYHAAHAIFYADQVRKDIERNDAEGAANNAMIAQQYAGYLLFHPREHAMRVGEMVIDKSTKHTREDHLEWEKFALELFNSPEFMKGKKPHRAQSALAKAVSNKFNVKLETVRPYFSSKKIPKIFIS